jgi:hypothetical protein
MQIKAKLSLCLIKHHAVKRNARVEVWPRALLTSAVDESVQLHSPAALPPGKNLLIGDGWAIEAVRMLGKNKISCKI